MTLGWSSTKPLESACCVLAASTERKLNTSPASRVLVTSLHPAEEQQPRPTATKVKYMTAHSTSPNLS